MPLGKKADAGDYVDDFKKSKAPQFKGKSQKKRKEMAIAAYLSSKNELTNIIRELIKEADPKKGTGKKPKGSSRRLYTDENPKDTVSVKFSSRQDIVDTLGKSSFKSKSHARQSQVINLIHQRTRAAYGRAKDPKVKKRLKTALDYITSRKEASKRKTKRMNKNELAQLVREVMIEELLGENYKDGKDQLNIKKSVNGPFVQFDFYDNDNHIGYTNIKLKKGWNQLHIEIFKEFQGKGYSIPMIEKNIEEYGYIVFSEGRIVNPAIFKIIEKFKNDSEYEVIEYPEYGDFAISNKTKSKEELDDILGENYKDGKVKGKSRPGRVKKAGASCKGSVSSLRAKAKKYGGEKGKMYHWCANMKSGRKKK